MNTRNLTRWGIPAIAAGAGMAVAAYMAYVVRAWLRYGHPSPAAPDEVDPLLERFMPSCDIVERHHVHVAAPADETYRALMGTDLQRSRVISGIFRSRQMLFGGTPDTAEAGRSLVETTRSLGWVVLAEVPGREIVMGAVTRPWEADVVFRGVPADEFAAFNERNYVKIVWTLRADAAGPDASIARTETRALATDADARRRFRWYWARLSPGIVLIRLMAMRQVKAAAEIAA